MKMAVYSALCVFLWGNLKKNSKKGHSFEKKSCTFATFMERLQGKLFQWKK